MFNCEVCGSTDFEKHAGFMYCSVCQTQSQDYYEQEYDFQDHTINISRQQKSATSIPKQKKTVYDDGLWTTWEAFNYILHGMSEELKKCGVSKAFEEMLFRVWMAYLSRCQAAFISRQERVPKLRFKFKERDARVLYSTDLSSHPPKKKKTRSKSRCSRTSDSTQSRRSILSYRRKVISEDYEDYLSTSLQTNSNLDDETLESLGRSSDLDSSDESLLNSKSFKHMFNNKDFKLFENLRNSKILKSQASRKVVKDVTFPAKNRLLSLIHLALLLTSSDMQLSDLLRFIRESHLSFAKVTHFFPHNVKLPKKDHAYIEVVSDAMMPTHLRQRHITAQLACLLGVSKVQTPDTDALIDRYCLDLNLPEQVAEFGKKILGAYAPRTQVPRYRHPLPSYEAWAMASIIFVIKLLLGLNDKTEIFLSRLAREANSMTGRDRSLFVFQDWQKFIECRKTVLATFHYPTQEQLDGSSLRSSEMFLGTLARESRDEHRKDRFIPYPLYYIPENLLKGLKEILEALNKPKNVASFDFEPSLTPQTSHLGIIMRNLSERKKCEDDWDDQKPSTSSGLRLPEKILKQSFRNCDLEFAFDPGSQMNVLGNRGELDVNHGVPADEPPRKKKARSELLLNCSSAYWLLPAPDGASGRLSNFKDEVLAKTPENFQWLITECARMVEMNVRDVYSDLFVLEGKVRRKPPWQPAERPRGARKKSHFR